MFRSSKAYLYLLVPAAALLLSGMAQQPVAPVTTYSNPILAGDYPDPSVIRVGDEFWATTTTSEWGPPFMLMRSPDLVNWTVLGTVFPERPEWAEGNFWASEIAHHDGKFFIYFTARKKGGPLCLASATAAKPEGPYTDHGPMVCQDAGSIDAFPFTDVDGTRYMVWKEDGNSRRQPTPLWAQPLDATGTELFGERKELMRNTAQWEGQLVEGPALLRRGDWIYMFYSGAACCGRECSYALGVARAKKLLGPWEKNPGNPILQGNKAWKCPGHGTVVTLADGRDYLMYHAYHARDFVYVGRQALLDRVEWGSNGWPTINGGKGPSGNAASPLGAAKATNEHSFTDDFDGPQLKPGWQWPQESRPAFTVAEGKLALRPAAGINDGFAAGVLARPTTSGNYLAVSPVSGDGGLAAFGDRENAIGLSRRGNKLELWSREKNKTRIMKSATLPASAGIVELRLSAKNGEQFRFAYRTGEVSWIEVGTANGYHLPPWDRGVRVALVTGTSAAFESLTITPEAKATK